MTFKACKYCQVTQIQWDTELAAFRESDGKLHDRKRCEGIRNNNGSTTTSRPPQQQEQQTQQLTNQVRSDVWLIPKQDWDKILSYIANITIQLEHLSEYYGDLLDHVRSMSRPIDRNVDRNEEAMAASEARYDQDKEDGLV